MSPIIFSHKGKRETNQDYVLYEMVNDQTHLALIADGMGGYDYGDLAAKLVANSVLTYLSTVGKITKSEIQKAINKANLAIRQLNQDKQTKSGATVGGIIFNSTEATAFWVGDVKIMHFKEKKLITESTPHTLMNQIIRNGSIKDPEQIARYKHVVTQSVQGDTKRSQIETITFDDLSHNDLFIVCSDGVHDLIDGLQIQQKLNSAVTVDEALSQIEERLLEEAKDNFSLVGLVDL